MRTERITAIPLPYKVALLRDKAHRLKVAYELAQAEFEAAFGRLPPVELTLEIAIEEPRP